MNSAKPCRFLNFSAYEFDSLAAECPSECPFNTQHTRAREASATIAFIAVGPLIS
jgi:hypothetical protein